MRIAIPGNPEGESLSLSRRFRVEWLLFGLAFLILGGYIGWVLYADRLRIHAEEAQRLLAQAGIVEQNLGQQLLAVDRSLVSIRDNIAFLKTQDNSAFLINRRLQAMSDAMPGVRTIVIVDADGMSIASNREQAIGQNAGQGERFQVARAGGDPARLYLSSPFKTPLGVYAMSVSKVVLDAHGAFAGIIVATLDPEYFTTLLNSVLYAPDMRASVIHGDGKVAFRAPKPEGVVGMDLVARPGAFFVAHMKGKQATSVVTGIVASTGEERLTVLRTILPAVVSMDKPLVFAVSREMPALFRHWRTEAYKQGGFFILLLLSVALSLWFYQRRTGAQGALREVESSLREAQEAGRVGSYVLDIQGDAWRSSPMLDTIFGIGAAFPRSMAGWTQIIHPAEREQMSAYFSSIVAAHRRFDREYRIVRASDGAERWVLGLGELELGSDGEPLRLRGTIQDITERKITEEALKQSEQRLRAIVETEPECVKVVGRQGELLEMNAAGLAMLEAKSVEEARGHTLVGFLLPEYRAAFLDLHRRVMEGESGTLEFEVLGLKGARRWLETHAAPMRDASGEITMLLGITRDITEHKQTEARRAQLEAQLRESQKLEALGTLAGGVAHDFNNIVAAILGNVELARQDVGPAHPALESLDEIQKASRRAKALVQQILAFGRRQLLERKVISLTPVVQQAATLLRVTLPAGVNLKVECAPDTPAVLADANQIEQVLLNLCSNACHALQGQERPGLVEIRLDTQWHAGRQFCALSVSDNGRGMDEATRARIFEPFFTTKPVDEGTGLGLSVVHGIVKEHGASIEVGSAPGVGTCFVIRFPAAQIPAAGAGAQDSPPAGAPGAQAPAASAEGVRVLYIDDDESIVFLMTRLLQRQGYRVSGYTDAREALAAARANPGDFDLVVTDYNMPGMTGLQVAQALREIRADLPVAMASGYITEELRQQAPAAGVSELIYKPNTVEDLCSAVARLAAVQTALRSTGTSD